MIFIIERNAQAINTYLSNAGLKLTYSSILQYSQECEKRFSDDQIPEAYRLGASCSKVWSDPEGAYDYTIIRLSNGYWGLTQANATIFQTQELHAKIML